MKDIVRCSLCKKSLGRSKGCSVTTVKSRGNILQRIKSVCDCNECGVKAGNYHHYGCDQEVCPFCGGQLLSCDCDDLCFLGAVAERTKLQKEMVEEFPWIDLDWKEWEISLVTDKYIFCAYLAGDKPVKIFNREGRDLWIREDTDEIFVQNLLDTVLSGLDYEYMSEFSKNLLELEKEELLKRIEESK